MINYLDYWQKMNKLNRYLSNWSCGMRKNNANCRYNGKTTLSRVHSWDSSFPKLHPVSLRLVQWSLTLVNMWTTRVNIVLLYSLLSKCCQMLVNRWFRMCSLCSRVVHSSTGRRGGWRTPSYASISKVQRWGAAAPKRLCHSNLGNLYKTESVQRQSLKKRQKRRLNINLYNANFTGNHQGKGIKGGYTAHSIRTRSDTT